MTTYNSHQNTPRMNDRNSNSPETEQALCRTFTRNVTIVTRTQLIETSEITKTANDNKTSTHPVSNQIFNGPPVSLGIAAWQIYPSNHQTATTGTNPGDRNKNSQNYSKQQQTFSSNVEEARRGLSQHHHVTW